VFASLFDCDLGVLTPVEDFDSLLLSLPLKDLHRWFSDELLGWMLDAKGWRPTFVS
jgi:hypothetical protein